MTDDLDPTGDHERISVDLGGYVLGGLTLAEQQAVEAHLETCSACRAELAELEGIPVLLDLARPEAPASPGPVTATAGPGVGTAGADLPPAGAEPVGWVRSSRHGSSRRVRVLVAAASALAVAAALIVGLLIGSPDEPDFGRPIPLHTAAAPPSGISADAPSGTASLRPTENGTVVRLDLHGLSGDGGWYECTWSSNQGDQSAGTFRPAPDGSAQIDLTTAARAYPGWKLTIIEHPPGSPGGEAVLEASA